MKNKFIFILLFALIGTVVYGQEEVQLLKGTITFITSNNVYVKFDQTTLINVGDTLQISSRNGACLLVTNKSSSSVVCSIVNNCEINRGDEVSFTIKRTKPINREEKPKQVVLNEPAAEIVEKPSLYAEHITGKISASTYSTLSNLRDDRHSVMSRFSLYAEHIADSKISLETYVNYRQNFLSEESDNDLKTKFLRVYDLSMRFDADPTLAFVIGRKINPKTSSLGAIDGLQVEKQFGNYYVAAIAGYRPDIYDYNFNSDLFEYGAYFGRTTADKNFYSQSTIGFLEQRNAGEIDRRYSYFQHSSTILKKLYLFSTIELDIYNNINGETNNDLRLTNLYASARYRFNKYLDATLSFDSRKRILYYETFQTEIERLLDDDIARQGARIRINGRPTGNVVSGVSYSKRFQSNDQNKSDNIFVYFGLSKIPGIGGRVSVNYNVNSSNYLETSAISLRHSRSLLKNKLNADFYYRFVNYTYLNSNTVNSTVKQNYYGANLSLYITRRLMLSVSGELSKSNEENSYRIYTKLIKRFKSKRKKQIL